VLKDDELRKTGLQRSDITECAEIMRRVYSSERMDERDAFLKMGLTNLSAYKDQKFYVNTCKEMLVVQQEQRKLFKEHGKKNTGYDVNGSLASTLAFACTNDNNKQMTLCRDIKKELKLNDEVYN